MEINRDAENGRLPRKRRLAWPSNNGRWRRIREKSATKVKNLKADNPSLGSKEGSFGQLHGANHFFRLVRQLDQLPQVIKGEDG